MAPILVWLRPCKCVYAGRDGSQTSERPSQGGNNVVDLNVIKITPRDEDVLRLLGQGCSNKEIARQLNISPRTVKQHLRTLFLRAGTKQGRKRVILTAVYEKEQL
jgi:DNA-binding NarL/FixJ family response regulator